MIKRLLPYLAIVAVFVVVACVYMSPALDGMFIGTSDGIQGTSAVHEGSMYAKQTGDRTWWTDSMFGGMPNYQIGGGRYEAENWVGWIKHWMLWGHRNAMAIVLIYCLGFFALLRSMKVDKWLSAVGALATAFSSYFFIIIAANHHGKTSTLALMSLALAGFYLIFNKHRKTGVCLAMLGTMAGFYPHPQMAYCVCWIFAAFGAAELCRAFLKAKTEGVSAWKRFGVNCAIALFALGVGVGTGMANTYANLEYAQETMRGGHSDLEKSTDEGNKTKGLDLDYATQWSYGIDECWTFLVPNYMGGSSNYNVGKDSEIYQVMVKKGVDRRQAEQFCQSLPTYWGDQPFTAGPVYMGALVCLLFVLGLIIVKGPYKWALLVVTLLSIILSWGHNCLAPTEFFFNYVPMYNKFRAVSSILVIAEITMPLLGFMALQRVVEIKERAKEEVEPSKVLKYVATRIVISGGILIVGLVLCRMFTTGFMSMNDDQMFAQLPDWLVDGIVAQREAMFKSDITTAMCLVILCTAVLTFYVRNAKFKTLPLAIVLGVIVLGDMWSVDQRYMNDSHFSKRQGFQNNFAVQPWEQAIIEAEEMPLFTDADHKKKDMEPMVVTDNHFRVFNVAQNPFNDARTSYRFKSIGGYSAAKLRRYQDLIDEHISQMHMPVIDMLNTRYFVVQDKESGQLMPQYNEGAMGNAWFVDSLAVVQTPNEACDGLMEYDLSRVAVVEKADVEVLRSEGFEVLRSSQVDSLRNVKLTVYAPDYVEYDYNTANDATLVFSEIYYPYGWKAYIDGNEVDYFRCNYMLRAMNVPAGNHHIRFEFRPESVAKGNTISMIMVLLMYLTIIGCVAKGLIDIKKQKVCA